jgi:hypothetical protein
MDTIPNLDELNAKDGRYCCFLDILGFKSLLSEFDKAVEIYRGMLAYIQRNIELNATLSAESEKIFGDKHDSVSIKILSDSIIFSSTNWYDVVGSAQLAQAYFFERGILIRGGIAFGRHAEFDGNIGAAVVSEALSRAYIAESRIAIYPRIIFDVSALDAISAYAKQAIEPLLNLRHAFVVDDLGTWFVEIPFHVHKAPEALLRKMYIGAASEDIMRKIRWLIDYYNYCDRRIDGQPVREHMRPDVTRDGALLRYQRFGTLTHERVMYWKLDTSTVHLFFFD